MKRTLVFFLLLTGLFLASCGDNASTSSSSPDISSALTTSSAEATSSVATSVSSSASSPVSSANEWSQYIAGLDQDTPYYVIARSDSIKKAGVTYQTSSFTQSLDAKNQIEHKVLRKTTASELSANGDTTMILSDIYETATSVYTLGEDSKYHVTSQTRQDFAAYTLPFDFSQASEVSVTYDGFDAILRGRVSEDKLAAFGESALHDVSDFTFQATLAKVEATPSKFSFAYTERGYSVSLAYRLDALPPTITLPTL